MSKMFLETTGGLVMEVPDHTQWFHDKSNGNQRAILDYHDAVIKAACAPRCAGSMEKIKKLARYSDDERCIEILVQDGKRL